MLTPTLVRPMIASSDFLGVFLAGAFVIIFGAFYAMTVTLVKLKKLQKGYIFLAFLFWGLQVYSMFYLGVKIHSKPFTFKAMMIVMIAYLMMPYIYFRIISKSEERYKDEKKESKNV